MQHFNRSALASEQLELPLKNGYFAAFTNGPLQRPRHINPEMEKELEEYKEEVRERWDESTIKAYKFPREMSPAEEDRFHQEFGMKSSLPDLGLSRNRGPDSFTSEETKFTRFT